MVNNKKFALWRRKINYYTNYSSNCRNTITNWNFLISLMQSESVKNRMKRVFCTKVYLVGTSGMKKKQTFNFLTKWCSFLCNKEITCIYIGLWSFVSKRMGRMPYMHGYCWILIPHKSRKHTYQYYAMRNWVFEHCLHCTRCVIAELFLEGQPLFELSQLLAYRRGQYDPSQLLEKVSLFLFFCFVS